MLKTLKKGTHRSTSGSFAIVASKYNARYVDAMLRAAKVELKRAGARDIQVVRVPGAFEIPAVAAKLSTLDPRPSSVWVSSSKARPATPSTSAGA